MNITEVFAWSCFINAFFSVGMMAFVLFSRPITKVKALWSAMCLAVGVWSVGIGTMTLARQYPVALLGNKILYIGAPLIPVFLFHTSLSLIKKRAPYQLLVVYVAAIVVETLNLSGRLCDIAPSGRFFFYSTAKPAYSTFVGLLYGVFLVNGIYLWKASKRSAPLIQRQLRILLFGTTLGFIGGQTTIPLVYGIPIFPWGNFFVPIYVLLVSYGMLRYQLLDFRLAGRRLMLASAVFVVLILTTLPFAWPSLKAVLESDPTIVHHFLTLTSLLTGILLTGPLIYVFVDHRQMWELSSKAEGLTHELKSPLSCIESAIDLLSSSKTIEGANREYLEIIRKNVTRLENLSSNLLSLSKSESENIQLKAGVASIGSIVRDVCVEYSEQCRLRGATLEVNIDSDYTVWMDADKIRMVLSNLLSNALKFSAGGTVCVSTSQGNGELFCKVTDDGAGMSEKELGRVFEPFYQGKKSSKGTGLGLSLARNWIRAHGGRIWAESQGEGKGTTVTFTLPIYQ